jgi:hypothetical protein
MNYSGLIPILVKDIQRQQMEINVLKEQVAKLLEGFE